MDTKDFDFCVLGAGLAGLATCGHLLKSGASVCLIDIDDIASGASGTPLGLVNPATGRFGTKTWHAEECYQAIYKDLRAVQQTSEVRIFDKTGILRPAQDQKMATRMHENVETNDWPEGWCKWLSKTEIQAINKDLHCVEGGMWLPNGLTVNVEAYLKAKASLLKNQGLQIFTDTEYSVIENQDKFEIQIKNTVNISVKNLIHTAGFNTKKTTYWDFLPVHPIKGQVAIFESNLVQQFKYSISALGYIASFSKNRFVAGSTYEHNFEHTDPDNNGLDYLTTRLGRVYPRLFEDAKIKGQWAGVRASSPNRKPILGRHPEKKNVFVFTSLGSKGLLYSSYLGKALSDFILKGSAIPKEVSLSRF